MPWMNDSAADSFMLEAIGKDCVMDIVAGLL
jgi:hypothetical protein